MKLNEELNKILKEMWRIDEKVAKEGVMSPEEAEFYKNFLPTIKNYYHEAYLYWDNK